MRRKFNRGKNNFFRKTEKTNKRGRKLKSFSIRPFDGSSIRSSGFPPFAKATLLFLIYYTTEFNDVFEGKSTNVLTDLW